MRELTKAEEQIMQVMWEIQPCFVKEILERIPEPKPAYNTVSTIVRILEGKGFIDHKAYGKTHQYFTIVERENYKKFVANQMVDSYFNGSLKSLVSFFVKQENIDLHEANEIIKIIEKSQSDEKPRQN